MSELVQENECKTEKTKLNNEYRKIRHSVCILRTLQLRGDKSKKKSRRDVVTFIFTKPFFLYLDQRVFSTILSAKNMWYV